MPEHVSKYIFARLRYDLARWRRKYGFKAGFNPDQPRDELGQWADASDSPSKGEMNIDAAVTYLDKYADPEPPGKGECATYVRAAIEAGGVKLEGHPRRAKDYYDYLNKYFDKITPTPEPDYLPKEGDIAVFQSPDDEHPHGHIQMYNGTQWVSDFKQPHRFWPGEDYEYDEPPYVVVPEKA